MTLDFASFFLMYVKDFKLNRFCSICFPILYFKGKKNTTINIKKHPPNKALISPFSFV